MRRGLLALGILGLLPSVPPTAASEGIARVPVTFEVDNVNGSALSCRPEPDKQRYRIEGELVGPASVLARKSVPVGTLYLHELSFGQFYWSFDDIPGYDYAEAMARKGHVSVVIDRLGYDASGHPPGTLTCLGAQADVAAQIVRQLKSGLRTPVFEEVVLAGHSVGGGVAELAAHSFPELDLAGLVLFAWADQGYSPRSVEQSLQQARDCASGGEAAEPGGPTGYAYFGRTEAEFVANVFHDADPAVVERATARRNRDPCGDNASLARILAVNAAAARSITVPVLLVFGDDDAVYEDSADETQAALFSGSSQVTLRHVPNAGHALALERSAPLVRDIAAAWLPSISAATTTSTVLAAGAADATTPREGATLPATGNGWMPPSVAFALLLVVLGVLAGTFDHGWSKVPARTGRGRRSGPRLLR